MNSTTRLLLLDYRHRKWVMWTLIGVIHFSTAVACYAGFTSFVPVVGCILSLYRFDGTFEWTGKSDGKTLATLPLSQRQWGLTRWYIAFAFLGLTLTALNGIAVVLTSMLGIRVVPFLQISVMTLCIWGIVGAALVIPQYLKKLGLIFDSLPFAIRVCTATIIVPLIFFWPIVAYWLVSTLSQRPFDGGWYFVISAISIVGVILGIYAYSNAERLVPQIATRKSAAKLPSTRFTFVDSFSGWMVLTWLHVGNIVRGLLIGLIVLVVPWPIHSSGGLILTVAFSLPIITPLLMSRWTSSLRVFRSLPITPGRIAKMFLLLANVPSSIALIGLYFAAQAMAQPNDRLEHGLLLIILIPLLLQSLGLALGLRVGATMASILTLIAMSILLVVFVNVGPANGLFDLALLAVVIAFGVLWTFYELVGRRVSRQRTVPVAKK